MHGLLESCGTIRLLGLALADASFAEVATALGDRPPTMSFSYVVTPNADHFVRLEGPQRERLMPTTYLPERCCWTAGSYAGLAV